MEIQEPKAFGEFLTSKPRDQTGWVLDPTGGRSEGSKPRWACIGPEGGWTPAELQMAIDQGWHRHPFPGHVLRIETACLAVAVLGIS
jgi:RsmE family RNA methyltransferase